MSAIIAGGSYSSRYRPPRFGSVCPSRGTVEPALVVRASYGPITRSPLTTSLVPVIPKLGSELDLAVARVYATFAGDLRLEPRVVRGVIPLCWECFREKHRQDPLFQLSR